MCSHRTRMTCLIALYLTSPDAAKSAGVGGGMNLSSREMSWAELVSKEWGTTGRVWRSVQNLEVVFRIQEEGMQEQLGR